LKPLFHHSFFALLLYFPFFSLLSLPSSYPLLSVLLPLSPAPILIFNIFSYLPFVPSFLPSPSLFSFSFPYIFPRLFLDAAWPLCNEIAPSLEDRCSRIIRSPGNDLGHGIRLRSYEHGLAAKMRYRDRPSSQCMRNGMSIFSMAQKSGRTFLRSVTPARNWWSGVGGSRASRPVNTPLAKAAIESRRGRLLSVRR